MQNRKILLIGAGGHCKSVLDSLLSMTCYEEIGIIDKKNSTICRNNKEDIFANISFIGSDEDLEKLFLDGYRDAFITIGSIGDTTIRRKLYNKLKKIGYNLPNIIDSSSNVSEFITMGEGVYIGKDANVNAGVKIGNCAIVNTAAVVEHQCSIGDFVHLAPGSILCGDVTVEEDTHIGAGSVIKQGIKIGRETVIGLGSIVVKDISSHVTAYGNPCREV